ncbi:GNAT family N-acetyltransferase [Dactylosporangium sp. NPDC005555]|uniref:GNAT family N-acetyltransferase n=1 Tax=Dactylosporangium sp. NPDC005555 TaxID=3154889 RepID=UPI0033B2E5A5
MTLDLVIRVDGVDWDDPAAVALRSAMTAEMRLRYADRFATRPQVEADTVVYTAVAFAEGRLPVGHAALRRLGPDLELKRMYVAPSHRGTGVAAALLTAVEAAAVRLGAPRIILQTGDRQPDAVRLYVKTGYTRIPIFPPYEAMTFSNCFQKVLPSSYRALA